MGLNGIIRPFRFGGLIKIRITAVFLCRILAKFPLSHRIIDLVAGTQVVISHFEPMLHIGPDLWAFHLILESG